jgi:hypothetical protein
LTEELETEELALLIEDADVLTELVTALFGVVEDSFLVELLVDVLIVEAVVLTVVFCTFEVVFAVVFGVVFAVVFTTGLGAGLVADLTIRTTGACNASFISCEAFDMQLQAAVSSSGVIPWMADDCLGLETKSGDLKPSCWSDFYLFNHDLQRPG